MANRPAEPWRVSVTGLAETLPVSASSTPHANSHEPHQLTRGFQRPVSLTFGAMAGASLVAVPAAAPAVDDHLYACFSAPIPAAALPIGRSTRCSLRTHMTLTASSTDLRQPSARTQPKTLFAMSRCLDFGDRRSDLGNPADVYGMAIRRLADPTVSKYQAIGVPRSARRARSSGSWLATARWQQRPIGRLASTQTVRGKPSRRPALPAPGHAVPLSVRVS